MIITVVWDMTQCNVVVKYSTNVSGEITVFFLRVADYAEHIAAG
jgi:hypothetical protein